jgi:phosphoglycolate phosphatase
LFDLDGTLVDSAPGITATLAHTFEVLGHPVPSPTKLLEFVGPPLLASFGTLAHMSEIEAANALAIYRERYLEAGVFNVTAYEGIPELLSALNEHGIPVGLATSKPESLARIALEHLGLLHYINVLTGASEDEVRSAKKDVVAEALVRLKAFADDVSAPVLIGDRSYDVEGAAANGVPTIFARWGYGSRAEEVGAVAVVNTPAELQALLLG